MGNCWVICWGSRDGCVGLLFESLSNWLHILYSNIQKLFGSFKGDAFC